VVVTILEFLDRWDERRLHKAERPLRDIRQFIGFAFLAGYYWMVYQFSQRALPVENLDLIRDAMLTLGPPVGLIVGAMFRSDARDEQATRNTGIALDAARTGAKAALASNTDSTGVFAGAAEETVDAADKADAIKGKSGG